MQGESWQETSECLALLQKDSPGLNCGQPRAQRGDREEAKVYWKENLTISLQLDFQVVFSLCQRSKSGKDRGESQKLLQLSAKLREGKVAEGARKRNPKHC